MTPVHCLRCNVRASQTILIQSYGSDDHFSAETVFYPFALQIRTRLGIATRSLTFGVRNSIIAACLGS